MKKKLSKSGYFDQVDDLEFKQKTNILLLNSKAHLRQDFNKHIDY